MFYYNCSSFHKFKIFYLNHHTQDFLKFNDIGPNLQLRFHSTFDLVKNTSDETHFSYLSLYTS